MENNLLTLLQALSHLNIFTSGINTTSKREYKKVKYHPVFTDKVIEEIILDETGVFVVSTTVTDYNSNGDIVKESTSPAIGYTSNATEHHYNVHNLLVKTESYEYNSFTGNRDYAMGGDKSLTVYEYNSENLLTSMKHYENDVLVSQKTIVYPSSNVYSIEYYSSYDSENGDLRYTNEEHKDVHGKMLFELDANFGDEITYQYNNAGQLVHKSYNSGDWQTLQYDDKGRFCYSQTSELSDARETKCRYIDNLCISEYYREGVLEDILIDDMTTNKRIVDISGNQVTVSNDTFFAKFEISNIDTIFRNVTVMQ